MDTFLEYFFQKLNSYRIHLLIFLLLLLTGITFAHPSLLLTDEWVTVNQLDQIHAGHQVIINEGKYGTFANGTVSPYFTAKKNILGYSLFLPLVSLPAYWLLDIFGDQFVFFILYLWTILLIVIALLLNGYFKVNTFLGKWRWTTAIIIGAFVFLLINFVYYLPFFVTGPDSYPEILAIVFTNIVLFACIGVFILEINLIIFRDTIYSLFGTVICITSSSYLFWTTSCKDHILTAFVFILVILMLFRYQKEGRIWYLYAAFISSGLLAWPRPELALTVFGALCLYTVFMVIFADGGFIIDTKHIFLVISPLFTLIGAFPFFINNFMVTGNPLLVPFTLWDKEPSIVEGVATAGTVQQNISGSFQPLFHIISASTNFNFSTVLTDFYGVLFTPQSGSYGIFIVTPLFLVAILLAPFYLLKKEIHFSTEEKLYLGIAGLMALAVFSTYVRGISGMNASPGIIPDIRYLSPIYLPLNIIGLIALQKFRIIQGKEFTTLWRIFFFWIVGGVLTLVNILQWYPYPDSWSVIFTPLNGSMTIVTLIVIAVFVISILTQDLFHTSSGISLIVFALLCALPLVWQVDASFVMRAFGSGLGGYSFWIPVVRIFFAIFFHQPLPGSL